MRSCARGGVVESDLALVAAAHPDALDPAHPILAELAQPPLAAVRAMAVVR